MLTQPGFRFRTRWPIEHLTGEQNCPERQAVLAVDRALVRYAESLSSFAQLHPIWSQLMRLEPYENEVPEGDPSAVDPAGGGESLLVTPHRLRAVESIASRPWHDLASARDYFRPSSQLHLREPDAVPRGEFLPYVDRRLLRPGDFIPRCMRIRIDHWWRILKQFHNRCHTANHRSGSGCESQWDEVNRRRAEL